MSKRVLLVLLASIATGVHASPTKCALGALGSRFVDAKPASENPYVNDRLVGMWFAEDFNGTSIPARFGKHAPPLVMVQSSAGTIVPTARGFTTEGGIMSFETVSIPSVVSLYNDFSYGREGEITFEHLADWTGLYGVPNTIYYDKCLGWNSYDSVSYSGNCQWVLISIRHTLNSSVKYYPPSEGGSFQESVCGLANDVRTYCPELLTATISNPNGVSFYRYLFGYNSSYKNFASTSFYSRSYNASTRSRFINGSFLHVRVRTGEEFLRCAIYLRALTAEEVAYNREVDRELFGLTK